MYQCIRVQLQDEEGMKRPTFLKNGQFLRSMSFFDFISYSSTANLSRLKFYAQIRCWIHISMHPCENISRRRYKETHLGILKVESDSILRSMSFFGFISYSSTANLSRLKFYAQIWCRIHISMHSCENISRRRYEETHLGIFP